MPTTSPEKVDKCVSTNLETLVVDTVPKVGKSPESMSRFLDAVIDSPRFILQVLVLPRSKQRKIAAGQAKIENRYQ